MKIPYFDVLTRIDKRYLYVLGFAIIALAFFAAFFFIPSSRGKTTDPANQPSPSSGSAVSRTPSQDNKDKNQNTSLQDGEVSKPHILSPQELSRQADLKTPFKSSLKELVQEASVVAIGKSEAVQSQWNESRNQIYTYITFEVADPIKGGSSPITIKQLGGQVGSTKLLIAGMPEFNEGEQSLLMLKPREVSVNGQVKNYLVAELSQGKFDLIKDPASGKDLVFNSAFLGEGNAAYVEDFVNEIEKNMP